MHNGGQDMQIIYKLLGTILHFVGLKNVILIEAERATRENTEAVFREMLHRGMNKHYRIVLISDAPTAISHWKTKHVMIIKRVNYGDSWTSLMLMRWLHVRACMIIDENKQLDKRTQDTAHVFLSHGSCVKSVREYYSCTPDTDYMLNQSEFWKPINEYQFKISRGKLVTLGYPRNDILFSSQLDLVELFGKKYVKVVVWYPTYRQHWKQPELGLGQKAFGIPIMHNEEAARRINDYAAKYNILLVVKPHPVQDVSFIQDLNLDHLKIVTDQLFLDHHATSYAFLSKTDALIPDYSSVVFDYLLTGKPIALTLEDYEEYEKKVGFAIDMNLLRSCATMLDTPEDFDAYFRDLVEGNDPLREKREALLHLTNQYTDGHSTERVVDWLETLLKN